MIMRERKKEKETHGGQSAEDMVRKSYARMNKSFGCSMILWYNYAGKEKQVAENTCSLIKSSLYAFFSVINGEANFVLMAANYGHERMAF